MDEIINSAPQSRMEEYLKSCINKTGVDGLPAPQSRIDVFLYKLVEVLSSGAAAPAVEWHSGDGYSAGAILRTLPEELVVSVNYDDGCGDTVSIQDCRLVLNPYSGGDFRSFCGGATAIMTFSGECHIACGLLDVTIDIRTMHIDEILFSYKHFAPIADAVYSEEFYASPSSLSVSLYKGRPIKTVVFDGYYAEDDSDPNRYGLIIYKDGKPVSTEDLDSIYRAGNVVEVHFKDQPNIDTGETGDYVLLYTVGYDGPFLGDCDYGEGLYTSTSPDGGTFKLTLNGVIHDCWCYI